MTTNWLRRGALLLCACALTAGCSTIRDLGSKGSSTDTSAMPAPTSTAVDVASLDTGKFPTEPAPPYPRATTDTIVDVEAQRLAEFVVLPFEVDPSLTTAKPGLGNVLRSSSALKAVLSDEAGNIAKESTMLYGYKTTAATPTTTITDPERVLSIAVIRFGDSQGASDAARRMHESMLRDREQFGATIAASTPEQIPDSPGTLISSAPHEDTGNRKTVTMNSFTAHDDYLIYTWTSAPVTDRDWHLSTVAKAVQMQTPLADRFPATPTKGQRGGTTVELPQIDQGQVLRYALPEDDGGDPQKRSGDQMAAYGPRGMAHMSTNPPLTLRVLSETGSEHNAKYGTVVYKPRDEQGAAAIVDAWLADIHSLGYTDMPEPAGLPDARCVSKPEPSGTTMFCYVQVGRYVGEASGRESKSSPEARTELLQKIAAQYVILTKADQN